MESQSFKVPHLRNMYQKISFNNAVAATSLDGFGFTHDGVDPSIFAFLGRPAFPLIRNDTARKTNLNAFLMCLDTGVAPTAGYTRTDAAAKDSSVLTARPCAASIASPSASASAEPAAIAWPKA